jgi:hypothetical protein
VLLNQDNKAASEIEVFVKKSIIRSLNREPLKANGEPTSSNSSDIILRLSVSFLFSITERSQTDYNVDHPFS